MHKNDIERIIRTQHSYFYSGKTKTYKFRKEMLERLKQAINNKQDDILQALKNDLNKPPTEAYVTEISQVLNELNYTIKHLKSWMKIHKVKTPLIHHYAKSFIYSEPYGIVLIIGPWNYPFLLVLSPLVGSIAAGNCAIIKPSEYSDQTSRIIHEMISEGFESSYISVIEGGKETSQLLLEENLDYIFYTGRTAVGKIIMEKASRNLTPVTLELGGKSPCVVDTDINIQVTARRIAWGKFLNDGQTCTAPDYLLVQKDVKNKLIEALASSVSEFFGDDPKKSPDYARIINEGHFVRLKNYLKQGKVLFGGANDVKELYIEPTALDSITLEDTVMKDEIFGPILPVIEYKKLSDAISIINGLPKPLALYFFSKSREKQEKILKETSSGGVCLNDTIIQVTPQELPFGGVGLSGIGRYHGKDSFDTFSNSKSVMKRYFINDVKLRYPPYKGKMKIIKFMMKYFS